MSGPWEKYRAAPAAPAGRPWEKYRAAPQAPATTAAPAAESPQGEAPFDMNEGPAGSDPMRNATFLAQRLSRSVADTIGMPVDLVNAALSVVGAGSEQPFMGSDWLANRASDIGSALGVETVPAQDVPAGTRIVGEAVRGAGNATLGAGALMSGPAQASKTLSGLAKPYATQPYTTALRDTIAGAGAGAGAGAYDEVAPDAVQGTALDPIAKTLASLMGGIGAYGLTQVAEGTAGAAAKTARNMVLGKADPNAPVNPATGEGFTRSQMDRAARVAQQMPTNRSQVVDNLDNAVREYGQFATPSETPTVGMLSDDIGMALQENVLRNRDPRRFIERDTARQSAAAAKIDATAPANADGRAFTGAATQMYDDTLNAASGRVAAAESKQAQFQRDLATKNADLEGYRAKQADASTSMAADFDVERRNMRVAKNQMYEAVDPKTAVDGRFLDEALTRIDAQMSNAERLNPGPYAEIAGRIRQLVGNAEDGVNDITYQDLSALRAQVSEARKAAVTASGQSVAGSGADVRRLDDLNVVLGKLADDLNPEAARFYREEYAPRFKQGRAGEVGAAMDRATRTGGESSATRPSEFASKFLRNPEDAKSLQRAVPGPKTGQNAREWMLGDLAKSGVLTDNAELRYDRFKKWTDANRGVIDQFPDLAKEVNAELANAQRGGILSKKLAADVQTAKAGLKATTEELRRSALQAAIGNNPENAVAQIMSSGDPETKMAEIVSRLAGQQDATDGLKAAVRDWIKSKTATTAGLVGEPDAVRASRANLEKLFRQHEKTLAKVYSADEMNALRQAHKLLAPEKNLGVRATGGSDTFAKMQAELGVEATRRMRVLEAGLKAKYGVLAGGGIFRTVNLFLQALPDGARGVEDILFEMQFNPELAKHLLTRPVKDLNTPAWNAKLNRLLATATGVREANED